MEDRLANLEKSLTNRVESVQPERSLTAGIDLGTTDDSTMVEDSEVEEKSSRMRGKKNKSRGFEITLFSWNVESEGSDPKVIAKQLSEMNRYDVYGLCEVLPEAIELYTNALGSDYRTIASRSGYNDRLQIIYNAKKYELLERLELQEINFEYRYRSPLVARLRDKATGSNSWFLTITSLADAQKSGRDKLNSWSNGLGNRTFRSLRSVTTTLITNLTLAKATMGSSQ